jgi:hypothetical protein
LPPPTPLNFAAAGESSAEYAVSRIIGHEFRQGVPFFNVVWDTTEETRETFDNPLPHSISAVKNYLYHCNDTRIRRDRSLPAIENLNNVVKIRDHISVKHGCSERWNCPRVAFQDALGLDIGRD